MAPPLEHVAEDHDDEQELYVKVSDGIKGLEGIISHTGSFLIRIKDTDKWVASDTPASGVVACEAKAGEPRAWCNTYGIKITFSFSTKLYTYGVSMLMAQEWSHRMQYLYKFYEGEWWARVAVH